MKSSRLFNFTVELTFSVPREELEKRDLTRYQIIRKLNQELTDANLCTTPWQTAEDGDLYPTAYAVRMLDAFESPTELEMTVEWEAAGYDTEAYAQMMAHLFNDNDYVDRWAEVIINVSKLSIAIVPETEFFDFDLVTRTTNQE